MRDTFNCMYNNGYIDHARLRENKTIFAARMHYVATEEFYSKAAIFNPISIESTTTIKSIGHSSIVDSITMTEEETGTLFAQANCKFVLICNDSKKSVPLPDWFEEKYSRPNLDKATILMSKTPSMVVPKQAFSHKLQTRHSDIDSNGHVATQEYFRFCIECAMDASKAGFYRQFVSEMWLYPVLEADVTFLGESREGMALTILTWQCESNASKMYFVILDDKAKIFECSFLFSEKKLNPIQVKL
ncbi:uncharacterized protein LOC117342484 [Pecten maximus]|uniref:uncharacterized protein LOC117342484 n=1 Tax=Pecten maximus TaxID=6579 RepID=UPI0014585770|nr:uncharacterized protein LOC117342484 [Pecten maximus]